MIDEDMDRLLGFHRRRYWLANGWSIWIRASAVEPSPTRPHGIRYSFSLHDEATSNAVMPGLDRSSQPGHDGKGKSEPFVGVSAAHAIPQRVEHDHWHRFRRMGRRVPYDI